MTFPFQTKRSNTASAAPTSQDLAEGELGVNLADRKIYSKNSADEVVVLSDQQAHEDLSSTVSTIQTDINTIEGDIVTINESVTNTNITVENIETTTGSGNALKWKYYKIVNPVPYGTSVALGDVQLLVSDDNGGLTDMLQAVNTMTSTTKDRGNTISQAFTGNQDQLYIGWDDTTLADPAFFMQFQFATAQPIQAFRFTAAQDATEGIFQSFEVQVSNDGVDWPRRYWVSPAVDPTPIGSIYGDLAEMNWLVDNPLYDTLAESLGGQSIAVVSALPGSPDPDTIYFVTA